MLTIPPIHSPTYLDRNFSNDFPKKGGIPQRVLFAALPLLSFYQPANQFLSHLFPVTRLLTAYSEKNKTDLAFSIAAFAATLFFKPVGNLITSLHDASINARQLNAAYKKRDNLGMAKEVTQLAATILYASSMVLFNYQLRLATLGLQTIASVVTSAHHFKNKHYIEGVATALFGTMRGWQLSTAMQRVERPTMDELLKQAYTDQKKAQAELENYKMQQLFKLKNFQKIAPDDIQNHQAQLILGHQGLAYGKSLDSFKAIMDLKEIVDENRGARRGDLITYIGNSSFNAGLCHREEQQPQEAIAAFKEARTSE